MTMIITLYKTVFTSKYFRKSLIPSLIGLAGFSFFRILWQYDVALYSHTSLLATIFGIMTFSWLGGIIIASVQWLKENTKGSESLVSAVMDNKPIFDENSGKFFFNGKECQIPLKTNQYFLCKKMFNTAFGVRIKEIDILDTIDHELVKESGNRIVYDALRAVNAKVAVDLGIQELFEWRNNTIWISDKFS